MVNLLKRAGFEPVGEWLADGQRIKLTVRPAKEIPSVYVFLLDGKIAYVGKAETCLRRRMDGYRNGKATQATNIRVRKLILEALAEGKRVELLVLEPEPIVWKALPVSVVVGLEAGLIAFLHPAWNQLNNRTEAI